jgi:long-subunit fatty acid transport protein
VIEEYPMDHEGMRRQRWTPGVVHGRTAASSRRGPAHGGPARLAAIAASAAALIAARPALASSGIDSPDSGVEQLGRGSAWVARADDPLAAYFNPAALAFQSSGVHLGGHLMFMKRCFTRQGDGGAPVSPGNDIPGPGAMPATPREVPPPAELCPQGGAFPNPQIGASFRITSRLAVGVALVAPHAAGGNNWPEALTYTNRFGSEGTQPAPTRYMLVSSDALILYPTLAVAYAPLDNLSFGAAFVWGVATLGFSNFSEGLSAKGVATGTSDQFDLNSDVRADLKAKDLFIPGFVLSALWSAAPNLDVAATYRWSDAIRTSDADLHLTSLYWDASGQRREAPCAGQANPQCNLTDVKGAATLKFNLPMEAKLGLRYHHPRAGAVLASMAAAAVAGKPARRVRDPLHDDLFDVELDFTWTNNSAVDNIEVRFRRGIAVNGTPGFVPENGDLPRKWRDVLGVRLGGDVTVIPRRLALRAGGFFETKGQLDEYLSIDFNAAQKAGLSAGGTVRVGPVDVSAAYQHTFFGTLDNGGKGAIHALSGDVTSGYRSQQTINGGSLRASLDEFGLSATWRF